MTPPGPASPTLTTDSTQPEAARASRARPSLALLHYSGPPVVGGVEAVMQTQARLFASAGYPTALFVGRGSNAALDGAIPVKIIPEMNSELPAALKLEDGAEGEAVPPQFFTWRDRLEETLGAALRQTEVVIAHNLLTTHFNLPLTAALHRLADRGLIRHVIVWCHDISRYVNPASSAPQRTGYPWDLLRRYRPDFTYVAVSARRQRTLAAIFGCPPDTIHVVPNGVDPVVLLGLSPAGARLAEQFGLLAADLVMLMPVRVTQAKNIEFAMQVTAALKAGGLRPRLVITGPPDPHSPGRADYFGELRQLRQSLALENEVGFVAEFTTGPDWPQGLPSSMVAELLRLADLVMMPSHREGFGIPVLEAGLMGRPVFATAIPAVEEVGQELVQVIGPDEPPPQVASRIRALAEHDAPLRLRRLTRQTYAWPAIFSRDIQPLVAAVSERAEGGAA
jgi:glycosyltransferase involved in cell wall biosynthesis